MKRLFILLFFVGAIFSSAVAGVQTKTITVSGHGISHNEALQNGLIEALKQTEGVSIDSQKEFSKTIKEKAFSKDQKSSHEVEINEQMQSSIREATQGLISKYTIINSQDIGEGEWKVDIEVQIEEYKTPGISPHNRRKIAIIPFRTVAGSFQFIDKNVSPSEFSRQFNQKLVTEITQTRKFTVFDREYMKEYLQEKGLVLSSDATINEQMKIGEVLGVDYLVTGTITNAGVKRKTSVIEALGEPSYQDRGTFIADYRIIVMATRQVKWSDSVKLSLASRDIKRIAPSGQSEDVQQAILDEAAKHVVRRAMENIYPIRVSQIQPNGELILNQGGMTVTDGQLFDVFLSGEKVIDQYTGESLGAAETWAAKIQIVRVIPKMSYARLIEGDLSNISEGSICRRTAKPLKTQQEKAQKIKPKW